MTDTINLTPETALQTLYISLYPNLSEDLPPLEPIDTEHTSHITQVSPVDVQKMSISDIGPILWMSVGEPSNIPTAETEIQRMYFF